ncbi:MAG: GNAT family N-acetyltransferase [candidate division WOR-3 bacterium]
MTRITPLSPADRSRAAATLARAFRNDPLWSWVFPDTRHRLCRLQQLFRWYLGVGLHYGTVEVSSDLSGVAMWLDDSWSELGLPLPLLLSGLVLPLQLGLVPLCRMMAAERLNTRLHRQLITGRHEHLAELGVLPEAQGRGVGTALVQHRLEKTELPCYVETQSKPNVRFYQRLGFELKACVPLRNSPVTVWCLVRPGREKV